MNKIVSNDDIQASLKTLSGWEFSDNKLEKELQFGSYMDGIEFINSLAKKAEERGHHPDLVVGYCKVHVEFTSHDLGGVSEECINMARYIESIANEVD
tara:strand:+ start:377 stop:670 length:294 start_codon:yes stop_codon:yes gene_type:complete